MRGPKPQPTRLKILKGNPGKRPLPKDEPQLPVTPVECPRELKGDARTEWERLARPMVEAGVLTIGDLSTFREYCVLEGEVRKLERLIHRVGRAATREMKIELRDSRKERRALAVELGLTPSARSRVRAAPSNVPDGTEEFLFGDRRSG